jgi:flagellar protein FliT
MSQALLDFYKAIEDSSSQMLEAAKAQDWEEIMRFEAVCAVLIEQLRHRSQSERLDECARREKTRIMLRILSNDAQIRFLAEPWLQQLESQSPLPFTLH